METFNELWTFMRVRKKIWLSPVILSLIVLSGLFVLAAKGTIVNFFIYML